MSSREGKALILRHEPRRSYVEKSFGGETLTKDSVEGGTYWILYSGGHGTLRVQAVVKSRRVQQGGGTHQPYEAVVFRLRIISEGPYKNKQTERRFRV